MKLTRYGVTISVSDERGEELLSSSQGYRKVEAPKSSTPAPEAKDEKPAAPKRAVRKDDTDK